MRYISTRGNSPPQSFAEILLAGLAPDGGLYMPETWPQIPASEIVEFATKPYTAVAFAVLKRFTGDSFSNDELKSDIDAAYKTFDTPDVAPLLRIGPEQWLLELFHGPTLAFKDIAMQLIGRLLARALAKRGGRATILAATSGDTGAAAIAAFGGLANVDIFVLHPKGRISEVQRRQMTTSPHANVRNIVLEGTFDDAQAIVKDLFAERDLVARANLVAVNSINFVRIIAQAVYYFVATAKLGLAPTFVVPTGNFGDVFAGDAAMRMGLNIEKLVVATNENDIVARALNSGVYAPGEVYRTLSPSMDIQVASNFERALFEASGRNSAWLTNAMTGFAKTRSLALPPDILSNLRRRYDAVRTDDEETLRTIASFHKATGALIDPHTAVALAADNKRARAGWSIVLSTAHPAKFPAAVSKAAGISPPLPPRLAGLYDRAERGSVLPADKASVRRFIEDRLR
jgi:threonine synthase